MGGKGLATLWLLLIWLAAAPAAGQGQPASLLPASLGPPPCPCEADLVAAEGFASTQVGYVLFDPASGAIAAAVNIDEAFIPASVLKVPTVLAALQVLGPDYQFETRVLGTAPIRDGVLAGDLYLKGGGDPFLTTEDMLRLVRALKDRGLTRVEGRFLYDESALPRLNELNPRQPAAVSYNPGLSGLNLNFNIVQLTWSNRGEVTGTALSRSDTIAVVADAISFAPQPQAISKTIPFLLDREAQGGERWLLSPDLPRKGEVRLPVRQPGLNAATIFRRLAAEQGILLPEPQAARAPGEAAWELRHESVRLETAAKLVLRYSNNLSAELIGLAAALRLRDGVADLGQSGGVLTQWLKERLPKTDWSGFLATNASGLSSDSRMTPRQMMAILTEAHALRSTGSDLYQLLSPVRWSDELQKGRDRNAAELVVRAKSGTVHFSRSLAGYMLTDSGRLLGFALFINDLEARAAYDATMNQDELADPPGAAAWMKRARALERALVTRWVTQY